MALPNTKVEIAFDSGFSTAEGSRTWTDVSAYVEGSESLKIGYGRSDELSVPDPNHLTVTFDNRDGRFTPAKASSPYSPNVKKGKPIRVTVTYNAVAYVRFMGYIDAWPLVWPDGSSAASTITVTASSRRARLGKKAPLQYSPISYAYGFPDWPQAYWKMDLTGTTTDGAEVFFDFTDIGTSAVTGGSRLFVHSDTVALQPSFTTNRREGPIDENVENGMLLFPAYTNIGLLGTFPHFVGGYSLRINTAGELTLEFVARLQMLDDTLAQVELARIMSVGGQQTMLIQASNLGIGNSYISFGMLLYDDTGALVHYEDSSTGSPTPAEFALATDGEIHHYSMTLKTGGTVGELRLDGSVVATLTFPGPYTFSLPFTSIWLGADTYNANAWIAHVAVRDSALTNAQITAHADAATTQNESVDDRVTRIAGYMGVPAAEVVAEASPAIDVGEQTQLGRTPTEVLEELALSTGGVIFDDRTGHLVMHARSHRYNQTAAFTLNATTQEIGADLTAILDDRYLLNYITVTRTRSDDLSYWWTVPASVDAYGTYSQSLEMVTSSWEEARAAAYHLVDRYSEPEVRISTVTLDLVNLSTAQRALVLAADIGTLFNISSLPAQAPTDPMPLYAEGYTETITSSSHTLSMNTTPGGWFTNVAVLDDASHDALDSGITLAY